MIVYTQAIKHIIDCLESPVTLPELTRKLGRPPMALQRAISGGYVVRMNTDPILYARGPKAHPKPSSAESMDRGRQADQDKKIDMQFNHRRGN